MNEDLQQLKALAMAATDKNIPAESQGIRLSALRWEASPEKILALIARIESLAADAERYKWLRNDNAYFPEEEMIRGGIELDQAIDAAIATEKA
jgi:hypothetical protein